MRIIIVLLIFFNSEIIFSQDNFEKNQRYILSGGTAHIGNGEVIENSILIIENGKIVETIVGAVEWDSKEMIEKLKML